jgi:hypothetical protein
MEKNLKTNKLWAMCLLFLSATLFFSSCSENEIIDTPTGQIRIFPMELTVGGAGGEVSVLLDIVGDIDINRIEYTVAPNGQDWVELTKDGTTLNVMVESTFLVTSRATFITLTYGTQIVQIPLTQAAADGPGESTQIAVVSGWATSEQTATNPIEYAFDGDFGTFFNSLFGEITTWPFYVGFILEETERLDYIIYHPRPPGLNAWGGFHNFDVYASTRDNKDTFVQIASIQNSDNHRVIRINLDTPVENPYEIRFVIHSAYNNRVSVLEMEFFQASLNRFDYTTIFTCLAGVALRPEVIEADIRRIPDADLRRLAAALYNNTYNPNFRVGSFRPFQNPAIVATANRQFQYSARDNPTGIFVEPGEEIVVLVGETRGQGISIVVQDLMLGWGANRTFPLFEGLNRIRVNTGGLIYVLNFTNDDIPLILETEEDKARAAAKTVDVHFVFGRIQGYFDIARHTNADWVEMKRNAPFRDFDIVGVRSHITWPIADFRTDNTTDIIRILGNFDELVYQQQVFTGLYMFDRMQRNRMYFHIIHTPTPGVAGFATQNRTAYNRSFAEVFTQYDRFVPRIWILGHEVGHMNQNRPGLTWQGMGEVSVNVYTMYNQRRFGGSSRLMNARAGFPTEYDHAIARIVDTGIPYACVTMQNDFFALLVPWWQLHLYLVEAQGLTNFWKYLHEHHRTTPIINSAVLTNGGFQLDFVRQVSRISGFNMVEFFQSWGFLTPIDRPGSPGFVITQAQINALITEINNMGLQTPHQDIHLIRETNIDSFR